MRQGNCLLATLQLPHNKIAPAVYSQQQQQQHQQEPQQQQTIGNLLFCTLFWGMGKVVIDPLINLKYCHEIKP